jgi:hypothetical protein
MMLTALPIIKICFFCAYLLSFTKEISSEHAYHPDYPEYHQDIMDMTDIMDNRLGLYKRSKLLTCGNYLTARLMAVCKSNYNSNKRGAPDSGIFPMNFLFYFIRKIISVFILPQMNMRMVKAHPTLLKWIQYIFLIFLDMQL